MMHMDPPIQLNTFDQWLITVGNIEVLTYIIPLALFIYFYIFSGRSPWRSTPIGKALAYQKISFTVIIGVILFSIFIPDYFGRSIVRILAYGAVGVSLWIDFRNLLRYQRMNKMTPEQQQKFLLDEQTKPPRPRKPRR